MLFYLGNFQHVFNSESLVFWVSRMDVADVWAHRGGCEVFLMAEESLHHRYLFLLSISSLFPVCYSSLGVVIYN